MCTKCIRYRHRYRYRDRNRYRYLWTLENLVHCRIFPPFTLSPFLSTFNVLLPPPHMHACCDAFAYIHIQYFNMALWLACFNKHEAAAAELMEATKRAGAMDRQVAYARITYVCLCTYTQMCICSAWTRKRALRT